MMMKENIRQVDEISGYTVTLPNQVESGKCGNERLQLFHFCAVFLLGSD